MIYVILILFSLLQLYSTWRIIPSTHMRPIHLGIVMLKHDPIAQAKMVQDATGVRTIIGEDLMTLDVGDSLELGQLTPSKPEWNDAWDL